MKRKSLMASAAIAGLMLASGSSTAAQPETKTQEVMCYGVNSCKGHGECAGKIQACSGKSGCEAKISCAGKNSCKGKGLKKMDKKDCIAKKGQVAS